jgi:hypothetical protein
VVRVSAHGRWAAELSTFETHAKAWLAAAFGLPPAAVLVALEGAGVHLPTWATALLAVLPLVTATTGIVFGPANKVPEAPLGVMYTVPAPAPEVPMPPLPDVTAPAPVTPPES